MKAHHVFILFSSSLFLTSCVLWFFKGDWQFIMSAGILFALFAIYDKME